MRGNTESYCGGDADGSEFFFICWVLVEAEEVSISEEVAGGERYFPQVYCVQKLL